MFAVKKITLQLNKKSILEGISLRLKKGTCLGIVGKSGAGKSSLLKIMAGLLDADHGEVFLDKELITGPKDKLIPGHSEIQLVNQDFQLDLYHTVYENLLVKSSHLQEELRETLIRELLDLLELNELRNRKAIDLSGGEKQRLAIGRALALEPKVLLLDEPFSHLDAHLMKKLSHYLLLLKKIRKTMLVIVSHDGQDLLHLADNITYLKNGVLQRSGSPLEFYEQPKSYEEGLFFGYLNEIKVTVDGKRRICLFRPHQYHLEAIQNAIQLSVNYKRTIFYGIFCLHVFQYKQNELFLTVDKPLSAESITSIFVHETI